MSANGGGAPHTAHRGSAPHPCIHAFIHSGIQRYRYNIEIKRVPLAGVSHTAIQATHSHYTTKISTRTNQPTNRLPDPSNRQQAQPFSFHTHTHTHTCGSIRRDGVGGTDGAACTGLAVGAVRGTHALVAQRSDNSVLYIKQQQQINNKKITKISNKNKNK